MLPAHTPEVIDPEEQAFSAPPISSRMASPDETTGGGLVRKLIVLALILGASGLAAWKIYANAATQESSVSKRAAGSEHSIPVIVSAVQSKTMPIYLTELGTVTAYNSVTIKTRVDGQLLSVNVREGQSVRKGQLLAEIDPEPYKAALAQAEGQLVKDKAIAAYASTEAQRYTALYNAGVVSQESAQTLVSNVGQTAGSIQADEAAIQAAKVSLAYTRIASPIDGVVGLRQVDPGNIVHAADATGLILVTQLQPITVIFTLPEDQLPQVQKAMLKGAKLGVEAYDRSETTRLATGKLLTLDNQIDTTTGTDKVKAVFDNKDGALFPNQFVNVRLILQQRQDAIVIPSAALQAGSQGNFVYVVKRGEPPKPGDASGDAGQPKLTPDAKEDSGAPPVAATAASNNVVEKKAVTSRSDKYYVEVRPITLNTTEGSQVLVASGLAAGEQIVIDGQENLKKGSKVLPQQSTPRPGRGGSKGGTSDGEAKPGGATDEAPKAEARPWADGRNVADRPKHHKQGRHP